LHGGRWFYLMAVDICVRCILVKWRAERTVE
jgi:hypothetical protein